MPKNKVFGQAGGRDAQGSTCPMQDSLSLGGKRSGTTLAGAPLNAASASKCRRFPRSCMGQAEPWAGNSSFLRFVISLDSSVCSAAKKRAFALFFGCFMALILLAL